MRRLAATLMLGVLLAAPAGAFAQSPIDPDAGALSATAAASLAEQQRLESEAAKLEALARADERLAEDTESLSFGAQLLKSVIVLGAVCALAYLILGQLLPRFMRMSPAGSRGMFGSQSRGLIEVVDRLPLDPKRTVYVMKVGGSHFLVGASEQGMSLLSRLDADDIAAISSSDKPPSMLNRLPGIFSGRAEKEG